MDRRSWPWKKKSSEKSAAEKAIATLDSAGGSLPSGGSQFDKQDNHKKTNYVQISLESYSHLTGLEDQIKTYEENEKMYDEQAKAYEDQMQTFEEEISDLNEKLSSAHTEITTKEELVKQHAKVAEEAVSGWEKAEAEALALKNHLESVTLAKLTVEDRAAHLDGALKECMRQIRNLKENNEKNLQELTITKNKQYDKMKHELETKIACLDQDLMRADAENAAISRSLQERSNMLIRISEEKSRAEAEIELLRSNVESCEREINSLKYELHIVSKEMEIRNEEKNMSVKSADVANRQQLENVKKIAKLEAECQRLRGLVKKKLPGPAALAQMKLEVESLGRDHGDARLRRSPMRPSSPQFSSMPEFSFDGIQKFQKENEFLTERLLSMEEETKMLKEALAKRNSELQTSRSICAKTSSKLQTLEAQVQAFNQQKGSGSGSGFRASNAPSLASFSEDGNDDAVSCTESWSSALVSEKNKDKSMKSENGSHLELMDDFEEMEKLARHDSGSFSSNSPSKTVVVNGNVTNDKEQVSLTGDLAANPEMLPLVKLQATISKVFESVLNESDVAKVLEDILRAVQEAQANIHPQSIICVFEEKHCSDSTVDHAIGKNKEISQELEAAISQIHDYILCLEKRARSIHVVSNDGDGLTRKTEQFSAAFNKVLCNEICVNDFVIALSDVMAKASELSLDLLGYNLNEAELESPTCIDKVALPGNKSPEGDSFSNGCGPTSDSSSNPEVPQEVNIKCFAEEVEQLKIEKDNMEREFFQCSQDLEMAKSQLKEMEQELSEMKSELASSRNVNSLAETQLKCMAESYKTLEKRAEELDGDVNDLREKLVSLNIELETERTNHQDALAKCRDLEEQLKRNEECPVCLSSAAEADIKAKQEQELEAAAEKLAACQETIFLLGKQLKSMRPQTEHSSSPSNERSPRKQGLNEDQPSPRRLELQDMGDQVEMDTATSPTLHRLGSESPLGPYTAPFSPSNTEGNISRSPVFSNHPRHSPTKSGSSSASSTPTPEKHSRGLTRFFSSKVKNSN